jgi:ATP-dependent DNA helicase Rep
VANQDDDPAFIRAITTPKRGVGQATLEVLGEFARQWQCSLFEAAFKGGLEAKLAAKQLRPLREFCNFILQLESRAAKTNVSNDSAAKVLSDMMLEIDYERHLYDTFDDRQAQSKWQNVTDFINWLKEKGNGGKDATGEEKSLLDLTQMVALMTMLDGRDEQPDAVRMSTLHAAKGLEFPHVFLVGVEEGILPHKGDPDAPFDTLGARIEEERRLMYVGITRAQRSLHISWCKTRRQARENKHCEMSRFIKEMKLDEGNVPPSESEIITPQNRLANLKALLSKSKDVS